MNRDIDEVCCGPDGKPDLDKMRAFLKDQDKANRLATTGWALFFIWLGIAWAAGLGTGIGLLGVGVITLGMQLVRKLMGVAVEGFWLAVGALFVLGAIWDLLAIERPLIPILLIVIGIILLVGMYRSRPSDAG
jgi:hypothetical protein